MLEDEGIQRVLEALLVTKGALGLPHGFSSKKRSPRVSCPNLWVVGGTECRLSVMVVADNAKPPMIPSVNASDIPQGNNSK